MAPDFANVLDAFVLVDLREAPAAVLSRQIGEDGCRHFIASSYPALA